jgi:hypothetical protein
MCGEVKQVRLSSGGKRMKAEFVPHPPALLAHEYDSERALVLTARLGQAAYAAIAPGPLSRSQDLEP